MTAVGIALMVVAVVLLIAEAHLSTGGLIAAVAAIAAVSGVAVLLLAASASTVVVLVVVVGAALGAASTLAWARRRLLRPLRARPRTGREALVGHIGSVRSVSEPELEVFLDGSLWRAEAHPIHDGAQLHEGDRVVVEDVSGLTLSVRRAEEWELSP